MQVNLLEEDTATFKRAIIDLYDPLRPRQYRLVAMVTDGARLSADYLVQT